MQPPGRLTGEHHSSFLEISTPGLQPTPVPYRRHSGDIGAELATHVHHLSPNPAVALAPVDPTNRLPHPQIHSKPDSITAQERR